MYQHSKNIRAYKNSDYEMICNWWNVQDEQGPQPGMMVENGTFIYEHNNQPILSLTVFLTQSNIGYIEGYISKPGISKEIRNKCGIELWEHCFNFAKENSIKHIITYTDKIPLVKRYESFGMQVALNNLTALIKDLGV